MDEGALYVISVASRLLGMHAQTLRKYERAGFVVPSRTKGELRLYSPEDIQRLLTRLTRSEKAQLLQAMAA